MAESLFRTFLIFVAPQFFFSLSFSEPSSWRMEQSLNAATFRGMRRSTFAGSSRL